MNSDDTASARALPPHAFESVLDRMTFNWCTGLDEFAQQQIRQKVLDASDSGVLEGIPAVAIVRRPDFAPTENDVEIKVYDGRGKRLHSLKISENGFGAVHSLS